MVRETSDLAAFFCTGLPVEMPVNGDVKDKYFMTIHFDFFIWLCRNVFCAMWVVICYVEEKDQ